MKFVTSNLGKKLIIILVILLLFNVLYPSMSFAVDLGGILLQPIYWLLLGIYIPADLIFGFTMFAQEFVTNDLDKLVENALKGEDAKLELTYGKNLNEWFIGPDTIFSRKYSISKC